jgi:hypothetical protein
VGVVGPSAVDGSGGHEGGIRPMPDRPVVGTSETQRCVINPINLSLQTQFLILMPDDVKFEVLDCCRLNGAG